MIGKKTAQTEEFWRHTCSTKDREFQSKFPQINGTDYHCLTFGSPNNHTIAITLQSQLLKELNELPHT